MNKKFSPLQMYMTALQAFAYTVLITSVFRAIFAHGALTAAFIWQVLGVAVATALLQSLFFTTCFIRRAPYAVRVLGFMACLLCVLALFALVGRWFPVSLLNWAVFVGSFLGIGTIITALITAYYAKKGREYTRKLRDYQGATCPHTEE